MSETTTGLRRRDFIGTGLAAAGALAFGPTFWREALAAGPTRIGAGPYGELLPPDANGLMLPPGFQSRIVARANLPVPGTTYRWPVFPDGKATFAAPDGGYVLVVNSESRPPDAGSSAIRFDRDGQIVDAYRILGGTSGNCAGGPTPWGTWLSCEEVDDGQVWECDPTRSGQGTMRPALGAFNHEAVAVDPVGERLYLTEDRGDGGFYRFTPRAYPDLAEGRLEVALVDGAGGVRWAEVPDPAAVMTETRDQVPGMRTFGGGEGIWFDSGIVYFATKGENRIYAFDTVASLLTVVYDRAAFGADAPLSGLDNVTVSRAGELYVCEDGGDLDMGLITREREVSRFFKLTGQPAESTEIAGVIFDPSGTRMYFSSQRADGFGITYEVSGPFRPASAGGGPAGTGGSSTADPAAGGPGPTGTPDGDAENGTERPQSGGGAAGGGGAAPQPGPGGGPSGEDVDVPGLRLRAPRSVSIRTLRGKGLPVTIELREPSAVRIAVRSNDMGTVPGSRGSVERPRRTTLGRGTRSAAPAGTLTVRVRIGPKTAARLRRGRRTTVRARITVLARGADGRTRIATRLVEIRVRRR